jgi:hypothetical protein
MSHEEPGYPEMKCECARTEVLKTWPNPAPGVIRSRHLRCLDCGDTFKSIETEWKGSRSTHGLPVSTGRQPVDNRQKVAPVANPRNHTNSSTVSGISTPEKGEGVSVSVRSDSDLIGSDRIGSEQIRPVIPVPIADPIPDPNFKLEALNARDADARTHTRFVAAQGMPKYSTSFEAFYAAYPHKVAKPRAWKAWKAQECAPVAEAVMQGLAKQLPAFAATSLNYVPHPSSWLNGRRWEDEVPDTSRPVASKPATLALVGHGRADNEAIFPVGYLNLKPKKAAAQ